MKVLIVEDNLDTRDFLAFFLQRQGYEVIEAGDGEEGLLEASVEHPEVILTDISMPGMNGIELINHLRHYPEFEGLKIVAVTGHGGTYVEAAKQAGADVVLGKPTNPYSLKEAIERLTTPEKQVT